MGWKRYKNSILVLLSGSFLIVLLCLTGVISMKEEEVQVLERSTYNGIEREEELILKYGEQDEIPIKVKIRPRLYSDKQIAEYFNDAKEKIPKQILGENKSLGEVWTDLNFVDSIENNPVSIEWQTSDVSYITPFGERTDKKVENKENIVITAYLSLQDQSEEFEIPIVLCEEKCDEKGQFLKKIEERIEWEQNNSSKEKTFVLPTDVDGKTLTWKKRKQTSVTGCVFFIVVIAGLVYWKGEKDAEKQRKERRQQMELDYPDVVSKLTLLLGAGVSLQRAWGKIVREYLDKYKSKKEKRFVYEEMVYTYREMENGVPMQTALKNFGIRCDQVLYLKFSTLLAQNLRRGNKGLVENLQRESEEAFEERKALARKLGEEAGTKLLIPMFLMLFMVLIIIMVPAIMSFSFS